MRGDRSQAGGISILAGVFIAFLCLLTLASTVYGRLTLARGEARRAVDAAAILALNVVRERGLPFDESVRQSAEEAGNVALGTKGEYEFDIETTEDVVRVTVRVAVGVESVDLLGGDQVVTAEATGELEQDRLDQAERRLPKLMLVLDYSGSMDARFVDGGRKVDALRSSVESLLAADLDVEYGAVLFGDDVYEDIALGSPSATIMDALGRRPRGQTNAEAPLLRASELLRAEDNTGYYVLFVSDGAPNKPRSGFLGFGNAGPQRGRDAAETLWSQDITIFSLEIRDSWQSQEFTEFMTDVSGNTDRPGDRDFHFVASSSSDMGEVFRKVTSEIVCRAGPIEPGLALEDVRVFLDIGGAEVRIHPVRQGGSIAEAVDDRFVIEPETRMVQLSATACDAVVGEGAHVVIRSGEPTLVE